MFGQSNEVFADVFWYFVLNTRGFLTMEIMSCHVNMQTKECIHF